MARPRNNEAHVSRAVEELLRAVGRLVDAVGDTVKAAPKAVSAGARERRRGPGKGNPKLKSKLKAYWASLSPAARKARIAKMHAWRKRRESA